MTDPDFIESKLSVETEAMTSDRKVNNNRYHYMMFFDEVVTWDWFAAQVDKVSAEVECVLEVYSMEAVSTPVSSLLIVEVREVQRRDDIDDGQCELSSFEE